MKSCIWLTVTHSSFLHSLACIRADQEKGGKEKKNGGGEEEEEEAQSEQNNARPCTAEWRFVRIMSIFFFADNPRSRGGTM